MSVLAIGLPAAGAWIGGPVLGGGLAGAATGAMVGASVGNAITGAEASRDAARIQQQGLDRQADVSREAADLIHQRYLDSKATLQPFIDAGGPAIERQRAILGLSTDEAQREAFEDAYAGPAFAYRRDRIIDDINRGASARGQLRSGNRLVELSKRLNELYATQGNNYFNQLGAVGGYGLSAAQANAGVGGNAATGQANALQNAGMAESSGQAALARGVIDRNMAFQSGIGDATGALAYRGMMLNQAQPRIETAPPTVMLPGTNVPSSGMIGYWPG